MNLGPSNWDATHIEMSLGSPKCTFLTDIKSGASQFVYICVFVYVYVIQFTDISALISMSIYL